MGEWYDESTIACAGKKGYLRTEKTVTEILKMLPEAEGCFFKREVLVFRYTDGPLAGK